MAKRIFAKCKVPSVEELNKIALGMSKFQKLTKEQWLDFYIKGRMDEIITSSGTIAREKQRINKQKKCIKNAIEVMGLDGSKGHKKELGRITKNFYKDIIEYEIRVQKGKRIIRRSKKS